MEDLKPSSLANCSTSSSSIQVLQDWELCMRLESYNGMFRSILEKFHRDIKACLSHVLIIHNETCACQDVVASDVNRVWNQKKLAFLELHKLTGLSFDDFLGRVLRLLLNNNLQNVEPLSESDFWQHLRQPYHQSPNQAPAPKAGTIDDDELADIQSFIMSDIEMGPTSSAPNHTRPRFGGGGGGGSGQHLSNVGGGSGGGPGPPSGGGGGGGGEGTSEMGPSSAEAGPSRRSGGGGCAFEESSHGYETSEELVRMKRKEKHMAPIDCTGVSAAFGHVWFCKPCGKIHKGKEECAAYKHIHNPKYVIPNAPENPGGMPSEFTRAEDGRVTVKPGAFVRAFSRLGPLEGHVCDESQVDFDEDRSQVWLLHRENGTRKCIVTASEADSNWLRGVAPAESAADANCLAVSTRDELFLVTRADVAGGAALSYFAKEDPTTEFWTCWTQAWANQRNCSRCSVHGQFETVADYRVHISLWHDMSFQGNPQNRIYYCPDCNARHIGAKDIVQHCRERHGTLPFQCRGCAKRFETYNSLIKHKKRLHAEEKPLKKACDRCDKVYLDPKALKQHIKQESFTVHEKSEQLHCGQCEMILSSKYALNRHIKEVHHRQQSHVCHHCSKHFTQQSNLKQHLLIHYGVKPFLCQHPSCKSAFTTKQCLQVHYRKVHRYTEGDMPEIRREKTRVDDILNKPAAAGASSPPNPSSSGSPKRPNAQRNATAALSSPVERAARAASASATGGGGSAASCEMDSAANSSSSDYFEAAAAARHCSPSSSTSTGAAAANPASHLPPNNAVLNPMAAAFNAALEGQHHHMMAAAAAAAAMVPVFSSDGQAGHHHSHYHHRHHPYNPQHHNPLIKRETDM